MRFFGVLLSLFLLSGGAIAEHLRGGVATGFPPYQFTQNGQPAGLDVEVAQAVVKEAGMEVLWTQAPWDDLTAVLRLTKDLDFLTGMENTGDRKNVYLLGRTLYVRKNLLFVLETNGKIRRVEDLSGQPVARDRDAFSEVLLDGKGLKSEVRLVKTDSKEAAFGLLAAGKVAAAFMPEAVGWALARQAGVAVRTIDLGDPGSPVSFAFRRDSAALAARLDGAILRLEKSGVLARILARYRAPGLQ